MPPACRTGAGRGRRRLGRSPGGQGRQPHLDSVSAISRLSLGYVSAMSRLCLGCVSAIPRGCISAMSRRVGVDEGAVRVGEGAVRVHGDLLRHLLRLRVRAHLLEHLRRGQREGAVRAAASGGATRRRRGLRLRRGWSCGGSWEGRGWSCGGSCGGGEGRHLSGRLALPVRAEEGAGADASLGGLVGALLVEGGRDAEDGAWRGVGRGEGRGEGRGVGRGEGRVPQSGMTSYAGPVASCVRR